MGPCGTAVPRQKERGHASRQSRPAPRLPHCHRSWTLALCLCWPSPCPGVRGLSAARSTALAPKTPAILTSDNTIGRKAVFWAWAGVGASGRHCRSWEGSEGGDGLLAHRSAGSCPGGLKSLEAC